MFAGLAVDCNLNDGGSYDACCDRLAVAERALCFCGGSIVATVEAVIGEAGLDFFRAFAERQCGATLTEASACPSSSPPLRGHPRARHQRADARASGRRSDAADFVPPDAARDATTTNPDPVPDPLAPHPRDFHHRPVAVPAAPRGARRPGVLPEPEPTHPRPPVPEPPVGPGPRAAALDPSTGAADRRAVASLPDPPPSRRKIPGLPTAAELLSGKGWVNREVGFFADALVATGLLGLLASPGPFTVFAPSNRAWYRALSALGATKEDVFEDPALTEVMLYHVARGETYTSGMFFGQKVPTLRPALPNVPLRAMRDAVAAGENPRARTSRSRKDSRLRCFRRSFERRISSTGAT